MRDEKEIAPETRKLHPAIAAHILFDRSVPASTFGFRGKVQDRHLLFLDQDFDIHMKITAAELEKEIHGQVIPRMRTEESFLVTLLFQDEPAETTTTDSFGEFSFHEVPTGNLAVEILLPSRRIVASFTV